MLLWIQSDEMISCILKLWLRVFVSPGSRCRYSSRNNSSRDQSVEFGTYWGGFTSWSPGARCQGLPSLTSKSSPVQIGHDTFQVTHCSPANPRYAKRKRHSLWIGFLFLATEFDTVSRGYRQRNNGSGRRWFRPSTLFGLRDEKDNPGEKPAKARVKA